jgi:hypothetical protein
MGYVKRKIDRREHETPKRARLRRFIKQGLSLSDAAQRVKAPHSIVIITLSIACSFPFFFFLTAQ